MVKDGARSIGEMLIPYQLELEYCIMSSNIGRFLLIFAFGLTCQFFRFLLGRRNNIKSFGAAILRALNGAIIFTTFITASVWLFVYQPIAATIMLFCCFYFVLRSVILEISNDAFKSGIHSLQHGNIPNMPSIHAPQKSTTTSIKGHKDNNNSIESEYNIPPLAYNNEDTNNSNSEENIPIVTATVLPSAPPCYEDE